MVKASTSLGNKMNGGDWVQAGSNGGLGSGGNAGRAIAGGYYSVHGTINGSTLKGNYNP